jgi:hypothetical protein
LLIADASPELAIGSRLPISIEEPSHACPAKARTSLGGLFHLYWRQLMLRKLLVIFGPSIFGSVNLQLFNEQGHKEGDFSCP